MDASSTVNTKAPSQIAGITVGQAPHKSRNDTVARK